jgi:hypothetical protein
VSARAVRVVLLLALAGFYLAGATQHARKINNFKARGDQSGYLGDAEAVYANWHGKKPPLLIGERNRMPLYAGFLALFYSPSMSDPEFFNIAKRCNIYLSLFLLAILSLVLSRFLSPLPATNLLLIVAFGYFVFKAGYAQSELLFYFLFFIAFLLLLQVIRSHDWTPALIGRAAAAGAFAALAHLTKAAMLPLMAIFVAACGIDALLALRISRNALIAKILAAVAVTAAFLVVLSPYISTNKRVFGQYFYNVNTTFYIWYEDWPEASVGTHLHGDGEGWPAMPAEQLPGASRYWREHTVGQILARVAAGLVDMAERSYKTYWYLNYVVLYLAFALALVVKRRAAFAALIRAFPAAAAFLMMYAVVYLVGIAFYAPVSGTGTTRFLIAHLLPLLFVLSLFFTREPFRSTQWTLGPVSLQAQDFHLLVSAMLAFDLLFVIWPRLMTTYGGF